MLQWDEYRDHSWKSHWKKVSQQGYDVIRDRIVDYGNREYYLLFDAICQWSPYCRYIMEWMSRWHFESLHPDAVETDHVIIMQADVIEILLAALRGHEDF